MGDWSLIANVALCGLVQGVLWIPVSPDFGASGASPSPTAAVEGASAGYMDVELLLWEATQTRVEAITSTDVGFPIPPARASSTSELSEAAAARLAAALEAAGSLDSHDHVLELALAAGTNSVDATMLAPLLLYGDKTVYQRALELADISRPEGLASTMMDALVASGWPEPGRTRDIVVRFRESLAAAASDRIDPWDPAQADWLTSAWIFVLTADAEALAPFLTCVETGSEPAAVASCAEMLQARRDPRLVPFWTRVASNPNAWMRFAALDALGGIGGAEAFAFLRMVVEGGVSQEARLQAEAADSIALWPREESIPVLIYAMGANPNLQRYYGRVLAGLVGGSPGDTFAAWSDWYFDSTGIRIGPEPPVPPPLEPAPNELLRYVQFVPPGTTVQIE